MGLFILTGSQQFGLLSGITQSLAGRVALISLLPFSLAELTQVRRAPADLDTGLACRLLGIQNVEQLSLHPQRGALFETWVVSELFKARFNQALSSNLYFWRDHTGNEVDIIMEQSNQLIPIEVKSGQTVSADFFKGLNYWQNNTGAVTGIGTTTTSDTTAKKSAGTAKKLDRSAIKPWLVYGGDQNQSRSNAEVVSWKHMRDLIALVGR